MPLTGFCVAWSVWAEASTVLVSSDGSAYFFGEQWDEFYDQQGRGLEYMPPRGIRYIDVGCGMSHVVLICSDGTATAVIAAGHLDYYETLLPEREEWFAIPHLPLCRRYHSVACGREPTVLIRDDGVAVALGPNDEGECEIRDPGYADGVRYVAAACGENCTFLF